MEATHTGTLSYNADVALDYAKLPNDPEELKQLLLKHANWIEALREEVLRLRRWRFGRSSEAIDVGVAPELPLTGGVTPPPMPTMASDLPRPPKLTAVDGSGEQRRGHRPPRSLPAELPRLIRERVPSNCNCPDCGRRLSRLGEDTSEQLDYVPARLYSLIGTCRLNDIDPRLYLRTCSSASPSIPSTESTSCSHGESKAC